MKLSEYRNPVSGAKGSVTNLADWWEAILGVGVLLVVFNVGQRLANTVVSKAPGGLKAGFSDPVFGQAQQAPQSDPAIFYGV